MQSIDVNTVSPERLAPLIGQQRYADFSALAGHLGARLRGRTVWNVSSTAVGGGVAEMLKMLVGYAVGAGVQTRWVVIAGDPDFFAVTKRIHNRLHGAQGDPGELGPAERSTYRGVLEANLPQLLKAVDPQTAGLAAALVDHGARVIWRCHVGSGTTNEYTDQAWSFLRPLCEPAHGLVFSRAEYAPDWVDADRLSVIAPAIDPFSTKNMDMTDEAVSAVLERAGIVTPSGSVITPTFTRCDGTTGEVRRPAEVLREGPPPPADAPLVVQVSRWDHLKDMAGVLQAFTRHVMPRAGRDVHLALVGPSVAGVADDPEGQQVLAECQALWAGLPQNERARISLVTLPTDDVDENAAIVNAIQRHAAVVVQKSLAEGFGLTVAEAMWKSRPVVASAVGGILDQITDGEQGLLVQDPGNLEEAGDALCRLLGDPQESARLGTAARVRCGERFLPNRELTDWAQVIGRVDGADRSTGQQGLPL